jgi:hypothetical protein
MDIITTERKGKHLDTLEKFHIFCSYKRNKHLNDNNIDTQNPILILFINKMTPTP